MSIYKVIGRPSAGSLIAEFLLTEAQQNYDRWLENYFSKSYEWNSFPHLLERKEETRYTGLIVLNDACVDIYSPGARRFSIFSDTFICQ